MLRRVGLLGWIGGLALLAGCVEEPIPLGPPEGWSADADRWWAAGFDTAGVFRDLESFDAMGIDLQQVVYGRGAETEADVLVNTVQYRLIRLYRNHPRIVDSLFHQVAVPRIRKAARGSGTVDEKAEAQLSAAYKAIARYFREPRATLTIGEDIPVPPRPDSLDHVGGDVRMQVYVDSEGATKAVELLEGVHPVLDAVAMRATAQMQWIPAYLNGKPIDAWARFVIGFGAAAGDS